LALDQGFKAEYDEATKEMDEANAELKKILALEKKIASEVSEDHVIAGELGKKLADVFPTIRTGYLVG
jgi:hypothetical protein